MIYDITNFVGIVESLGKYLNLDSRDIVRFVEKNADKDVDDFLSYFNIDESNLLMKEICLTSLHVTTNNDNCSFIKQHGIVNLQKAVTLETPLKKYLQSRGITIDVNKKKIIHNGNVIDISKEWEGIEVHKGLQREGLDRTIWKLYKDYQVNGFFYSDNVLNYGGYVNTRPEFLIEISKLLLDSNIESDWTRNSEYDCYVIKFVLPLSDYADFSFDIDNMDLLEDEELEIEKRKWVITKSLDYIKCITSHSISTIGEPYSYLKFEKSVPPSGILRIYTPEEYKEEFYIND
jgi:hypothetical protein